jgi:hypothetical protein
VKPAHAVLAEDLFPIEIANFELRCCGQSAVGTPLRRECRKPRSVESLRTDR